MFNTIVLFFALTLSFPLLASTPCSSLWGNGFPEAGRVSNAGECFAFTPVNTSLNSGQEMYLKNETVSSTQAKEALEWAADALVYTSNKYSAFASVPKIRLVYSEVPYPGDSGGNATSAVTYTEFFALGSEFCPIVIYPFSSSLSKEHFYQLIAHEIYHCVQKVAFPRAVTNAANADGENRFWFEGIAQYMSNSVYPSNDFEYSRLFGLYDQHLPFFQQSSPYLSEGIFQGIFWHSGSSDASMHSMQNNFNALSSVDDALAIPNISDAFHKSARDMGMKELRDSAGHLAPWPIERQSYLVSQDAASTLDLSFFDFAVEPFQITFAKKSRFHLNVNRVDGAKLSLRKLGSSDWQTSFDTNFDTECEEERTYEGIYTRVSPDIAQNNVHIDITRESNPTCACKIEDRPSDDCLYGTWSVDKNTVRAYLTSLMRAMQIISISGDVALTFTPDGQHRWFYNNLTVMAHPIQSSEVTVTMIWNGANDLSYSNGEGQVCSRITNMGVQAQAWGEVRGRRINMPVPLSPISGEGSMRYRCNDTTFSYDINTGPLPLNWVWHRVTPRAK